MMNMPLRITRSFVCFGHFVEIDGKNEPGPDQFIARVYVHTTEDPLSGAKLYMVTGPAIDTAAVAQYLGWLLKLLGMAGPAQGITLPD